jgi:hypothetical protein
MKNYYPAIFYLLFLYVNLWGETDDVIFFKWAFLQNSQNNKISSLNLNMDTSVKKGDRFKVYLAPTKNEFIYLLLFDSQNELVSLFPSQDHDKLTDNDYIIPGVNRWFVLDGNTGTEVFYLLVSKKRLINLENQLGQLKKSIAKKTVIKEEIKQSILLEIKNLIQENSKYTILAENPVVNTGTVKSKNEYDPFITEVKAESFYYRIIKLKHE